MGSRVHVPHKNAYFGLLCWVRVKDYVSSAPMPKTIIMQNEHNASLILQSAVLVKERETACSSSLSGLQQQTLFTVALIGCVDRDFHLLQSPPSIKQSEQPVDSLTMFTSDTMSILEMSILIPTSTGGPVKQTDTTIFSNMVSYDPSKWSHPSVRMEKCFKSI